MSIEKVYLELTNKCNLNCTMCYRNAWDYETSDMPGEVLEKCLKEINETSSIKEVVLGGIGEPTYAEEVERVMYALKDKYLTLTTNGTIMHPKMLETIVDTVDHLVISIDGNHDTFFSIRQFPLDEIINNMKALNEYKKTRGRKTPAISVQMVLSTSNKDQVYEIIDIAESIQASQVIFSNILPTSMEDSQLVLYKLYENTEIQELFQGVRNYAFRSGLEVKFPAYQLKTDRRCRFIEDHTLVITATGDVTPCYRLAHDGSEVVFGRKKEILAHTFGNIKEESLREIWENSAYESFRSTVYNNHYPSCIDCELVDGCDMVRSTTADCYGVTPSCADCLWSRKIIYCV
ncbi:MAG: tungsten cofactor oxidoreductase radical SAM maturase [Firmicutes bacterium HGW-Firmicutes-1]|jgi:tungsten cofactor oxidoreducase radical SAM maturase|nr:MAG: tungsten cofactor oxidoreductase radical SAM maturase [Firmicutes bacterium HGW-Firmicutes-1]